MKLKNSEETVLLDDQVYEWLSTDPFYHEIGLLANLRKHSSGCAVFQKTWKRAGAGKKYKTETIYLHKLVAEKFLSDQRDDTRNLVGTVNGDKLDCRLENLVYRSRATASRQRKASSRTGFTGVYQEHNRYRAVISVRGKLMHIGMFDTVEEAAAAYNKMSREIYGEDGKINKVR